MSMLQKIRRCLQEIMHQLSGSMELHGMVCLDDVVIEIPMDRATMLPPSRPVAHENHVPLNFEPLNHALMLPKEFSN